MLFSATDNLKRQPVFSVVCGIISLLQLYLNESSDIRRELSSIRSLELSHERAVRTFLYTITKLVGRKRGCKFMVTYPHSCPPSQILFYFTHIFHVQ